MKYRKPTHISTVQVNGTRTPVTGDSPGAFRRALKIFNRKVADADILGEARRREFYEKPSVRRKREAAQARRRELRRQMENELTRNPF